MFLKFLKDLLMVVCRWGPFRDRNRGHLDLNDSQLKIIMPAKYVFMRSGEATHNAAFRQKGEEAFKDAAFRDARLTDEGVNQCNETGEELSSEFKQFHAIYTSPLTRCIQTAILMKQWIPCDNFNANDDLAERRGGSRPCNERRPLKEIRDEFEPLGLNCDLLTAADEEWNDLEPLTFVESRVVMFLRNLIPFYEETDACVLVVSHHDVLWTLLSGTDIKAGDTFVLDEDEFKELLY